jgi:hypothetical protein
MDEFAVSIDHDIVTHEAMEPVDDGAMRRIAERSEGRQLRASGMHGHPQEQNDGGCLGVVPDIKIRVVLENVALAEFQPAPRRIDYRPPPADKPLPS